MFLGKRTSREWTVLLTCCPRESRSRNGLGEREVSEAVMLWSQHALSEAQDGFIEAAVHVSVRTDERAIR